MVDNFGFKRVPSILALCSTLILPWTLTGTAAAQDIMIGLAAPLSGSFEILGRQFSDGARVAAGRDGQEAAKIRILTVDDRCSEEGGRLAAQRFVEAKVDIVMGFLCTPAIEAAMPILSAAGIEVLTPVRTTTLTDSARQNIWTAWRLGPGAEEEANALPEILLKRWRTEHFAIVDDGTIYGRNLADHFRASAEMSRLKPAFVDTFRPQMDNQIGLAGRLKRAGASHVLVGGDRSDIAIIARDAHEFDYPLEIAGGEALLAADDSIPLAEGVLMVAPRAYEAKASAQIQEALAEQNIVAEGYVMSGVIGVEIASGALRAARNENTKVEEQLARFSFDTSIGVIRFGADGHSTGAGFALYRYNGTDFVTVQE